MKKALLIIITCVLSGSLFSQEVDSGYTFTMTIKDAESSVAIDSVQAYLYPKNFLFSSNESADGISNNLGEIVLDSISPGEYILQLYQDDFKPSYYFLEIYEDLNEEFEMYSIDSEGMVRLSNIAMVDQYHGSISVFGYSPDLGDQFKSSRGFDYLISFKFPISKMDQIGFDSSLKFMWHKFDNETVITPEVFKKERYFEMNYALYAYNRLILSKVQKSGFVGAFFDAGVGYELPLYFRYLYSENDSRMVTKGIANLNHVNAMARLGYRHIALKTTYRLTSIMKDGYTEPVKWNVGLEFSFSEF